MMWARRWGFRCALALGALPAIAFASCHPASTFQESRPVSDLRFRIVPRATEWLQGADVVVDLEIDNHGPDAVELIHPMMNGEKQPLFRLRRPNGEEVPFAFGARWPEGKPSQRMKLGKGQGWRGDLIVSDAANMTDPGIYELSATMQQGALAASAAPVKLEVYPARFRRIAAAIGRDDSGVVDAETVILQVGKNKLSAVAGLVRETHADIGEASIMNYVPRADVPVDTVDLLAPYTNTVGMKSLDRWVVAASHKSILAAESTSGARARISATAPIAAALTPLLGANRRLTVSALLERGDETELAATTLAEPAGGEQQASLARVGAWPGRAAAAATLAPEKLGGAAVFVVAYPETDAVVFELWQWDRVAPAERIGRAELRGWTPEGSMAVGVRSDGAIFASGLVRAVGRDVPRWGIICFDGKVGTRSSTPARLVAEVSPEGGLLDAHMRYFESKAGALSGVALLRPIRNSGAIVVELPSGKVRPPAQAIPARSQIALIPGQTTWYAATLNAESVELRSL